MTAFVGVLNREADATAGMCECDEVDRVQINTVLGIAEEHHLLPLDLSERIVLDDDNFDRQLVFYGRNKVGHQHGESSIPDKGNALSMGECDLRGDGVGQSASHGREIARDGM